MEYNKAAGKLQIAILISKKSKLLVAGMNQSVVRKSLPDFV
jgi:hypothetical protein